MTLEKSTVKYDGMKMSSLSCQTDNRGSLDKAFVFRLGYLFTLYNFKMPLFGNKFTPKKPPPRKSSATAGSIQHLDELVGDDRVVKLKLGEQQQIFRDGEWVPGKYFPSILFRHFC